MERMGKQDFFLYNFGNGAVYSGKIHKSIITYFEIMYNEILS